VLIWALLNGVVAGEGDPIGSAAGLQPLASPKTRVVVVEQAGAVISFSPRLEVIRQMVDRGLTNFTLKPTVQEAWRSLVAPQDVVGLKVFSAPGAASGTRPAVVEAVVQSLLAAGQAPTNVIVWDRQLGHLRLAGYVALAERHGIRVEASAETGYDTNHFYDSAFMGQPVWGDHEFGLRGSGVGRKSYVSKLVTQQMTKIINVTPLLNHNLAGVSGNLLSLSLGSVDNTVRFVNDASQLALAVPEIYALPVLGDRVVLNIVDALLVQYHGEARSLLHYTAVLNQLRFSADPVALDVLSLQELERQRELVNALATKPNRQLYQNAALVEIGTNDPNTIQVEWVK